MCEGVQGSQCGDVCVCEECGGGGCVGRDGLTLEVVAIF